MNILVVLNYVNRIPSGYFCHIQMILYAVLCKLQVSEYRMLLICYLWINAENIFGGSAHGSTLKCTMMSQSIFESYYFKTYSCFVHSSYLIMSKMMHLAMPLFLI